MLKKVLKLFAVLSLLFSLVVVAIGVYFHHWMDQQFQAPFTQETQVIRVKPGQTPYSVIKTIQTEQETSLMGTDWRWLKLWLKLNPEYTQIKRGTYKIEAGDSLEMILAKFVSGKEFLYQITLIEGETYKQWLQRLKKSQLIQDDIDQVELLKSWNSEHNYMEGLLLPETYSYSLDDKVSDVLRRSYQAMNKVIEEHWDNREQGLPFKNPYEALIMASIVEKESGVAFERPMIASVFINRLRKRMKLQTDPTVIYGMGDSFDGDIRRKDLRAHTAYNTYVIKALPPTPIAMASLQSFLAVLHPDHTRYLYFVATGKNGEHYFSKNLKEHNRAVRKYIFKK